MGPVSSFRENILPLVTVEVTGVQAQEAVLIGLTWPPTVPVRLGIPGTVSARPGGHPIAPHCWPPWQVAFREALGVWPSPVGPGHPWRGACAWGPAAHPAEDPACLEGGCTGSFWAAASSATVLIRLRVHRADGGRVLRMCGGSCPDPSTDPSSVQGTLPSSGFWVTVGGYLLAL